MALLMSALIAGCATNRDPYEDAVRRVNRELSVLEMDYEVYGVQRKNREGGMEVDFIEGDYRDKAAHVTPKHRTVRVDSIDGGRDSVIEVTAVDSKLFTKRRNREAEREWEERFLPEGRED